MNQQCIFDTCHTPYHNHIHLFATTNTASVVMMCVLGLDKVQWKGQGVKSREAHMMGVVVVKWLIVAHQRHPNTHHQVLPKTIPLIALVLAFPPMESPLKEGKGRL